MDFKNFESSEFAVVIQPIPSTTNGRRTFSSTTNHLTFDEAVKIYLERKQDMDKDYEIAIVLQKTTCIPVPYFS